MSKYTYESILQDIRTLDDLRLLTGQIDGLLTNLFKATNSQFQDMLHTKLQRTLGNSLILSLKQQGINLDNQEQLQVYFDGLREYIAKLPILQLVIAYHPTNEQLEQISDWARMTTGEPIILSLIYNKNILGGAVITYQGRVTDLSVKKKLEAVYETKQEEILNLIETRR